MFQRHLAKKVKSAKFTLKRASLVLLVKSAVFQLKTLETGQNAMFSVTLIYTIYKKTAVKGKN